MSDDIKLPEPARWLSPGGMYAATRTVMPPANGDVAMYTAAQLRAAVLADRDERASAAEQVCYEAYQVVGSMLDDMGQFNTERARKVLDNLSQAKKVHEDVLPWPSFKVKERLVQIPQPTREEWNEWEDKGELYERVWATMFALQLRVDELERSHGIAEKESTNG